MNDNAPDLRSIWPIATVTGPAIRAVFSDKQEPVVWPLTPDQAVSFCMELLSAVQFPKVS
jgi:hypothetical protein